MDLICPNCQKRLSLEDRFAGQVVRCPLCNGMFQAPMLPAASAGAAPAPPPAPPPLPPSGAAAPPSIPEPIFEPTSEVATVPQGDYSRTRGFHIRPDVLSWIIPICLTLLFLLSFFPWYWSPLFDVNLWQLAFGQNLIATYTFYVVVLFFLAWPLSIVLFLFEQGWLPLPAGMRPLWAWRSAFLGGLILLAFVFFLGDYVACMFRQLGNPATIAMKLAIRVHFLAVLACVLLYWVEQRRAANLPLPKVEIRW